jgi:putative pyruvate formate lyase activating enzyme
MENNAKYLIAKENSALKEKLKEANEIMKSCHFCERRCGVNRKEGERGWCRVLEAKISSEFLHFGEERELIPSHTIFFSVS